MRRDQVVDTVCHHHPPKNANYKQNSAKDKTYCHHFRKKTFPNLRFADTIDGLTGTEEELA